MNLINIFGLICVVFVATLQAKELSDDEREMVMMFTEECRNKHKATEEDMNNMFAKKAPETQSAKCTMACCMRQFKTMEEESKGKFSLNVDTIVKLAEAQGADKDKVKTIREISEKCKSPAASDECEFAAATFECGKKEAEARGIDFSEL